MKPVDKNDLVLRAVQEGTFPRLLYKYMALNDNTKSSLSKMQFWFAKPETFNDPFDCSLSFDNRLSTSDYKKYLKKLGASENHIHQTLKQAKTQPSFLKRELESQFKRVLNRRGVFSSSKTKDNLLMWAHYSSNHTGLVVELQIEKDPSFFQLPVNVEYLKSYKPLDYYKDPSQSVIKTIQTKSVDWEYEKEVRIVKDKYGLHPIKPEAVSSIYFGCRADQKDIDEVRNLLSKAGHNGIKLFKASKSHGKFKIHFSKLGSII